MDMIPIKGLFFFSGSHYLSITGISAWIKWPSLLLCLSCCAFDCNYLTSKIACWKVNCCNRPCEAVAVYRPAKPDAAVCFSAGRRRDDQRSCFGHGVRRLLRGRRQSLPRPSGAFSLSHTTQHSAHAQFLVYLVVKIWEMTWQMISPVAPWVLSNAFLFVLLLQTVSEAFREANLAASFGKAINFWAASRCRTFSGHDSGDTEKLRVCFKNLLTLTHLGSSVFIQTVPV